MDHLYAIFAKNDENCKFPEGNLSEIHRPVTNRARFRRETGTDAVQFPAVGGIFAGIAFLLDLLQGFFRSAVQLELEDINVVGRLQHTIHTALALCLLHIHRVHAHQTQDQIERVLEVTLPLRLIYMR